MSITYRETRDYFCLSTDTKPTLLAEEAGRVLHELDTNKDYYWNGSAWVDKLDRRAGYVWNPDTLAFEAMVQPLIESDTLQVALAGVALAVNQTNGDQLVQVVDSTGAELDMIKQNDLFSAGIHGISIMGLDDITNPARYRQLRVNTDGEMIAHLEDTSHNIISPATEDKQDDLISAFSATYDVRIAVDSGDSNITYIGKAAKGSATASAVWQIKQIDKTTGVIITWCDDDALFNNIWDNREALF